MFLYSIQSVGFSKNKAECTDYAYMRLHQRPMVYTTEVYYITYGELSYLELAHSDWLTHSNSQSLETLLIG